MHTATDDIKCLLKIFEKFYGLEGDPLYEELEREVIDILN